MQKKYLLSITFLLLGCFLYGISADTVILDLSSKRLITPHIRIYEDVTDTLKFDDIFLQGIQYQFKENNDEEIHIDFGHNSFWLHFVVKSNYDFSETFILELDNSTADKIQVFRSTDSLVSISRPTGDTYPFETRTFEHDNFVFEFPVQGKSVTDCYIHIQSNGNALNFPIYLHTSKKFIELANRKLLLNGIFIGLIVAIALASLFTMAMNVRGKNYYFFVFYILAGGLWILNLDGFNFQHFWRNSPNWNEQMNVVLPVLGCFFLARFALGFLNIKKYNVFLHKSISISSFILLGITILLFTDLFSYSIIVSISLLSMILISIHLLLSATFLIQVSARNAQYFLFAYTPFLIGVLWLLMNVYFGISTIEVREIVIRMSLLFQITILYFGITEKIKAQRREYESALKTSKEKYSHILENTHEGIFVYQNHRIQYCNERFLEIIKHNANDIQEFAFFHGISNNGLSNVEQIIHKVTSLSEKKERFTFNISKEDSEPTWIEMTSVAVDWDGEVATLNFIHDISERIKAAKEREKLEIQLWQSQKMETVGTLAGGIAHDFNNILTPILGYSELVLDSLNPESEVWQDVKSIEESAKRAKELIKQILTFSRQAGENTHAHNISKSFYELEKFMKATLPSTVQISINNLVKTEVIHLDPTNVNQILINLTTNAYQALNKEKGSINITAEIINGSTITNKHSGVKPIKYLKLCVSDNGSGISPDIINRIFEPFYTTKGIGEGTGLGLSVVHGIVQNAGGVIFVDSEVGKGSTFTVLIPAFSENQKEENSVNADELIRGEEQILLVDDEYIVSETLRKMLTKLGYNVDVTNDSTKAMQMIEKDPAKYHLIISDVTMPYITGVDIAHRSHRINPNIRVLLITGLLNADDLKKTLPGFCTIIKKPIDFKNISREVRTILDLKESNTFS